MINIHLHATHRYGTRMSRVWLMHYLRFPCERRPVSGWVAANTIEYDIEGREPMIYLSRFFRLASSHSYLYI